MNAMEIEPGESYWAATPDGEVQVRVMWRAITKHDSWACLCDEDARMIFESRELLRPVDNHASHAS